MINALDLASDVAAAGAALAGLLLVFIGGVAASYGTYRAEDQQAVKAMYQRRGWFGFVGFLFSLGATALAILGKWNVSSEAAFLSLILIFIAFLVATATALWTVWDIR